MLIMERDGVQTKGEALVGWDIAVILLYFLGVLFVGLFVSLLWRLFEEETKKLCFYRALT